jgi:hypothetical protein
MLLFDFILFMVGLIELFVSVDAATELPSTDLIELRVLDATEYKLVLSSMFSLFDFAERAVSCGLLVVAERLNFFE